MRRNNRHSILEAALTVLDREGPAALTFDAVSRESGVTRQGVFYHFPTREHFISELHRFMANRWEQEIAANVPLPSERPTAVEKFGAYVQACTHGASAHRLHFMLSGWWEPELSWYWLDVVDRWAPPPPECPGDDDAIQRFVARLASEGLKAHLSLAGRPLQADVRDAIAEQITTLVAPSVGREMAWSSSAQGNT